MSSVRYQRFQFYKQPELYFLCSRSPFFMQGAVREISVSLMIQKNSIAAHISFNPLSPNSD